jgi:sirohydrochlorin cobaltochelatase
MNAPQYTGLILFAHGSRDSQWRKPFESILEQLQKDNSQVSILAFLECMEPSLSEAIDALVIQGIKKITVVPVFLAVGSHVRKDLPLLLEQAQQKHPALQIQASAAIGEQLDVQQAIAEFALNVSKSL